MGAVPPMLDPISQTFAARVAAISARVSSAKAQNELAPGQDALFTAEIDAASHANAAHDRNAPAMLDAIERQLSELDRVLSRANDGGAIVVHPGDDVMVAMHDPYIYDIHSSNPDTLKIRPGVMWTRGVQGLYVAQKPGVVTFTVVPRPNAAPSPPAQLQKPVTFIIVVLPKP